MCCGVVGGRRAAAVPHCVSADTSTKSSLEFIFTLFCACKVTSCGKAPAHRSTHLAQGHGQERDRGCPDPDGQEGGCCLRVIGFPSPPGAGGVVPRDAQVMTTPPGR